MLPGELCYSPLSQHVFGSDTRSPYFTLLTLMEGMAAYNQVDDDVLLENGLLSFENPNYHLDPARLDDALNSNTETPLDVTPQIFDDLYQELDAVCQLNRKPSVRNRRNYASLDIGSMGVDVTTHSGLDNSRSPDDTTTTTTTTDSSATTDTVDNSSFNENEMGLCRKTGSSDPGLLDNHQKLKPDLIEHIDGRKMRDEVFSEKPMDLNTPDSNDSADSGIQTDNTNPAIPHIQGEITNDLYALPVKRRSKSPPEGEKNKKSFSESTKSEEDSSVLPAGWEKHEDKDGPYYWHIKTGTIQREAPTLVPSTQSETRKLLSKEAENALVSSTTSLVTRSNTTIALSEIENKPDAKKKEELAYKRRSYPARLDSDSREKAIRFAVRSLGWVEIAEEDLTPERSSKAVNRCIVDLSLGRNVLLDVVGKWGDGKDLFMDLDEGALKLIDPENLNVLNTQPIHTIRVWGVGRDNGRERDFAYVARDRVTRKHMCHVFRCDMPARVIANTLRDICKKIMIERSLTQNLAKPVDTGANILSNSGSVGRSGLVRPTNLPTEHRRFQPRTAQSTSSQSFPTPMEEPKKVIKCFYLGTTQVSKPSGIDVLNEAIDRMMSTVPEDQRTSVNVSVAPSVITISDPNDDKLMAECRVRYLSFLGIGKNVKQCAFIMHTAQDIFLAHVFLCEPSSGALCKTIEAACKLRYQKCLDAHPQGKSSTQGSAHTPNRGIGATLKNMIGTLTGRKGKIADS